MENENRINSFMSELNSLLTKYNAEIEVKNPYEGGTIEVTFNSKYDPYTYERLEDYIEINLGSIHRPGDNHCIKYRKL